MTPTACHWDSPSLTSEQEDQIKGLVIQNEDIFALNPSELGVTNIVIHTIDTGDNGPICQQARQIPFVLHAKVDSMTTEMWNKGSFDHSTIWS